MFQPVTHIAAQPECNGRHARSMVIMRQKARNMALDSNAVCYVKGAYLPLNEATVSIEERGFLFGDGVFETVRVQQGVPLFAQMHLQRCRDGLAALHIPPPAEPLKDVLQQVIRRNCLESGVLRLSVSRGIGSRGYLPTQSDAPTVVVQPRPLPPAQSDCSVILSCHTRPHASTLPGHAKLSQGIGSTLARLEAQLAGADEALLLSTEGMLAEAASANLFWFQGDELHMPALATGCVNGIIRQLFIHRWPGGVREVQSPPDVLHAQCAPFITNAVMGVTALREWLPAGPHWQDDGRARRAAEQLCAWQREYIAANRAEWLAS